MTSSNSEAALPAPLQGGTDRVYGNRFRKQRFAAFLELVDVVLAQAESCRILDLGGEIGYWEALRGLWQPRRLEITLVNPHINAASRVGRFSLLPGDARSLPTFADNSFDIVHSNSVIEHVGRWIDMRAMATEVRRLAPAHFVQTPNYWFPLEPHMRMPFIHWLPRPWRRQIVTTFACGFYSKANSIDAANRILADAWLIDRAEMHALFPDASIVSERFGPFTKSLIAVRRLRE